MQEDYRVKAEDKDVLSEARKRYERATAAASKNRERYKEAMRFVGGAQWDDQLAAIRKANGRPCLVMDRLGTHINQVVNDQRQSKPAIKVHPVDDKADVKTAEIFNGVIRNIEHRSNAPMVYETASFTQVAAGQGAWRILTEYADENAFEQDIILKRIQDPTSITWDPDAKEMDASDAKFCFIETQYSKDAFKEEYPDAKIDDWPGQNDSQGWWDGETVKCAEYYRIVIKPTTLYLMPDGSVMDQDELMKANQGPVAQPLMPIEKRPGKRKEVQWFKLGGHSVLDSRIWPGKWIPVVRVIGNEMVVDGEVQYTGLTHRSMDPQRMYNYQTSVMVEMLSLQKTAPWVAAEGQVKDKKKWAQANQNNNAVLEYTPVDLNGVLAPPPQRQPAPQVPTGNVQAMQTAAQDLQWITGQHAANFGAASNETSGRAIRARQAEGDTATYHYLDNLGRGILHTGRILVDLIPRIYDTKRVLRVLGEDDTAKVVQQDPDMSMARAEVQAPDGSIQKIYNLGVGRYDVAVAVGPSFGTLRQEATEAMTQLLQGNPQMWQVIGDLYVKGQDWPYAQEIAARLAKMVPPEVKAEEEGGDKAEQKLAEIQPVMAQMEAALQEREAMLQQAGQALQQMEGELQTLKSKEAQQQAQAMDKTQAAMVTSETERYRADADVEIARINAEKELLEAQIERSNNELAELKEMMAQVAQAPKEATEPAPNQNAELLALIAQGQQQTAQLMAAVLQASQNRTPMTVDVRRGPDGRAQQFIAG